MPKVEGRSVKAEVAQCKREEALLVEQKQLKWCGDAIGKSRTKWCVRAGDLEQAQAGLNLAVVLDS